MTFIRTISTPQVSDFELVSEYKRSGDIKLLGTLYERYMDLVYGVCLKYLKNAEPAKDAVMQIFEELVQKLYKYEVDNFRGWLYMLAKNHCLMQLRSPQNMKIIEFDSVVMQSGEEMHRDTVLQKEEDLEKMEQCLETLSHDQRETVKMFYLENKCYKEISDITGKEFNKVRSLIQNGKRNLKICMEKNSELKV